MTTYEEIKKLREKSEFENLKYELKSSKILKENNWKDKIAKEIVSFANKNGGKVIIGLQNDGTFDGERDYHVDKLKGDIDNIIHNKISPIINYNFEFLKCEGGDLSIITIEKKNKDIPYAYIVKREGPEIKSRIYYIRTPHGKRLVSDQLLKYLFQQEEIDFNHYMRMIIIINEDLNMNYRLEEPKGVKQQYSAFLANLPEDTKLKLIENKDNINALLLEISPYLLLRDMAYFFQRGWNIKINDLNKDMQDRVENLVDLEHESLTSEDIPILNGDSYIDEIKFDLKKYLNWINIPNFKVPKDLVISVTRNNKTEILMNLKHPYFNYEILFKSTTGGLYLITNHPQYIYLSKDLSDYNFKEIRIESKVNFVLDNLDNSLFDNYLSYTKNLRQLIEERFSYDYFLKHQANLIQYIRGFPD